VEARDVEVDVGTGVEVDAAPADVVVGEIVVFSTGVLIRPLSHVHSYPRLLPSRRCDAEAVERLVATAVVPGN